LNKNDPPRGGAAAVAKNRGGLSGRGHRLYATGLSLYVLAPSSGLIGLSKGVLTAAVVPFVVGSVYLALRLIRKRIAH